MRVSLYYVEDSRMLFVLRRGEDAFNLRLGLRCLIRREMRADSCLTAAAQVYYDAVGVFRLK